MAYETYGPGVLGPYYYPGEPDAGTDAVQTATLANITGGTFRLFYDGYATAPIDWTDTDGDLVDNIQAALDDLPNGGTDWIVASDSTLSSGLGDVLLTFSGGDLAARLVPLMTSMVADLDSLTPTIAIATTTTGEPGVDAIQTATLSNIAGGTFTLTFDGVTSAAITWSATTLTLLANIQAALDAMSNLGEDWVVATDSSLTDGNGDLLLTFSGSEVDESPQPDMTAATTGLTPPPPSVEIAETTPGVTATFREIQQGAILVDTLNAVRYIKTGATGTGIYTKVGDQT